MYPFNILLLKIEPGPQVFRFLIKSNETEIKSQKRIHYSMIYIKLLITFKAGKNGEKLRRRKINNNFFLQHTVYW